MISTSDCSEVANNIEVALYLTVYGTNMVGPCAYFYIYGLPCLMCRVPELFAMRRTGIQGAKLQNVNTLLPVFNLM